MKKLNKAEALDKRNELVEYGFTIVPEVMPSVFFRTSYCNLRCIWCDTPYTSWQPEDKDISVEDAVNAILAYNCPQVVITGGEPFIQAKELTSLCQQLHQQGQHITIETNGTQFESVEADLTFN